MFPEIFEKVIANQTARCVQQHISWLQVADRTHSPTIKTWAKRRAAWWLDEAEKTKDMFV